MSILKNPTTKELEKPIENLICDYLSKLPGGYVCQIELSGRPVRKGNFTIMIPFKGEHYRVGMSDILFFRNGKFYALEVKTPKEHKYIIKHYEKLRDAIPEHLNKKQKHLHEQITFIENIKRAGGIGNFVSCLEDVKNILQDN